MIDTIGTPPQMQDDIDRDFSVAIFLNTPIYYDPANDRYSADYMNLIDYMLEFATKIEHLVLCLPTKRGNGAVDFEKPENVTIKQFSYYMGAFDLLQKSYRIVPEIVRLARSTAVASCDIIGTVAPSTIGTVVSPICHHVLRKPLLLFMRGDKRQTVANSTSNSGFKGKFHRLVIRLYDKHTAISLSDNGAILFTIGELSQTLSNYGYNSDKIHSLTPLIPDDIIVGERSTNQKPTDILYVGRLSGEKGIRDLLYAYSDLLGTTERELTLHIVGSGPEEDDLKKQASDLGISTAVCFHGFVPRGPPLWKFYDRCDIFILPSYTEGLPRVIGEAMARGIPIITTNVGGIPELITDTKNGMLFEPGDVKGLKDTINTLLQDPGIRTSLSKEALKTAPTVSFSSQADQMTRITAEHIYEINEQ